MYDEDVIMSLTKKNSTKAYVEAAIAEYEGNSAPKKPEYNRNFSEEADMVLENVMSREAAMNRYHSFSETVSNSLVTEAIYKIFKESVPSDISADNANASIMRAITCEYVNEHGYCNILNRMKTASVTMSEMFNTIDSTSKAILEEVDKTNPETFVISPEMKDEFFKQLDYTDSQAIADAINDRVSTAVQDFVTANTKDHEDITAALQQAQEQIADVSPEEKELKEYYQMKVKREINDIRNAPKNVFHAMVSSMCESVMKNPETHGEFMTEGHIDMDKVVTRTRLMYTFMEMLNTTRLDKVDEVMIEQVIEGLKN